MRGIEFLVSRGHRLHDVLRTYTIDQVEAFVIAGKENERVAMAEMAVAYRNANHAKARDFSRFVQKLARGLRQEDTPADGPDPVTVARLRKVLAGKPVVPKDGN